MLCPSPVPNSQPSWLVRDELHPSPAKTQISIHQLSKPVQKLQALQIGRGTGQGYVFCHLPGDLFPEKALFFGLPEEIPDAADSPKGWSEQGRRRSFWGVAKELWKSSRNWWEFSRLQWVVPLHDSPAPLLPWPKHLDISAVLTLEREQDQKKEQERENFYPLIPRFPTISGWLSAETSLEPWQWFAFAALASVVISWKQRFEPELGTVWSPVGDPFNKTKHGLILFTADGLSWGPIHSFFKLNFTYLLFFTYSAVFGSAKSAGYEKTAPILSGLQN